MTLMDRIRLILSDPEKTPMTLAQIVSEEIDCFRHSEAYLHMKEAEQYYRNRSDVQKKTVRIANRSNTKIEHPILKKLVDQKVNFLLSKPWTVSAENEAYGAALQDVFDLSFRRRLQACGKYALQSGIAYLQPYFADGKLAFMRLPSDEVIPIWADAAHERVESFIRFYEQTVYVGQKKETVSRAEFWFDGGVRFFVAEHGGRDYVLDQTHGTEENGWTESHVTVNGEPFNWPKVPLCYVKYNDEELPLCYFVKELIDDINWQTSVTSDCLRDVAKFIFVLKNYGGQDLAEFLADLQEFLAVKVDDAGGVDKLQAEINIDAVMAFLENHRRNLYDYAAAVDTKDPNLGTASGSALNFRYQDLEADCMALGSALNEMCAVQLKPFLDTALILRGKGDFSGDTFFIVFNTDMPINEADTIQNCKNSMGLISKRTIVANHPWVKDAESELRAMDAEDSAEASLFGDGI